LVKGRGSDHPRLRTGRTGRPRQALHQIDQALRELDGVARARALTQRGTILLELGRCSEAVSSYRTALPVLHEAGDLLWIYRVVANRGLAYAYRYEFAAAETDLRQAEQLAGELMLGLSVGFAQANLAFVLGLRGEVTLALDYSSRAEKCIRAHQAQLGELLKDRSELLLSVRLVAEARETPVMIAFHRLVAAGLPVADALATAQQQVRGDETVAAAAARFRLPRCRVQPAAAGVGAAGIRCQCRA
jgi:tetratricopeptide (TPR) repeat protein